MKKMFETVWSWLCNSLHSLLDRIGVVFLSVLGYLSPIEHIVHLVLFFFFMDVIYGWMADRKLNGATFRPKIVWEKTMPRVMFSVVLLIMTFMLDEETNQHWISTHLIVGWIINALLFISILKNGYIVTNWGALPIIGRAIKKKIEDESGLEIKEESK